MLSGDDGEVMGILRFILALAVVVAHTPSSLQRFMVPGPEAVQAFYIVSGFYMALVLNEKYNFAGATRIFYQQRYLRLAPMYLIAVLMTIGACAAYTLLAGRAVGKLEIWAQHGSDLSAPTAFLIGISQFTMFGLDALMFCGLSGDPLALHFAPDWMNQPLPAARFLFVSRAWTLSLELMFYIIAPFLLRRSVRTQLLIIAGSFSLRVFGGAVFGLTAELWSYRFFPFEVGIFLLGSVAYKGLPQAREMLRTRRIPLTVVALSIGTFVMTYRLIPIPEEVRHWTFIAFTVAAVPFLFAATQHSRMDRWVGELSYPLYLTDQVTLFTFEPIFRRVSGLPAEILHITIPIVIAVICYFLFERPIETWRARLFDRRTAKARNKPADTAATPHA
jgi:peptidoglycan/LPS O-acetylase OafA/YrhL